VVGHPLINWKLLCSQTEPLLANQIQIRTDRIEKIKGALTMSSDVDQ
jgi:hypothetical protein